MSAGKGRGPMKGYNYQAYADNYDQIFRKPTKPKRLKTMKTNQDGKEPAPVLAWHLDAAHEVLSPYNDIERPTGSELFDRTTRKKKTAAIIAAHDPHQAQNAETARLLEAMLSVAENCDETGYADGVGFVDIDKLHAEIRAHLASLQQEGAAK